MHGKKPRKTGILVTAITAAIRYPCFDDGNQGRLGGRTRPGSGYYSPWGADAVYRLVGPGRDQGVSIKKNPAEGASGAMRMAA